MKTQKNLFKIVTLLLISVLISCSSDDKLTTSQLPDTNPENSELDNWIDANYVDPYNIAVYYNWNQNKVDNNRFLFPPYQDKVQPVLEIVKTIWLDSYTELGGPDFVKKIAPREIVLVGGINLNTTGTVTLGLAEAGQRITLFETDNVNKKDRENVQRFIATIQHEYIHILNQTKPFNEQAYEKITPAGYTTNWYATSIEQAREEGFITDYARASVIEDFAEMASIMLTYSKEEYESILGSIVSVKAVNDIKAKEALVVSYFKQAFDIDFYALRDAAERNTDKVVKG
jgi:substrate import-associated zinc metallohydrolase lipoprotein